jgi:hypothetical protein
VHYIGLLMWEREQLASVKRAIELPVQPPELDNKEVLLVVIVAPELQDLPTDRALWCFYGSLRSLRGPCHDAKDSTSSTCNSITMD